VSAGSVALASCSGGGTAEVKGTSVEAPDLASVTGTVADAQGWQVRVVITSGTRSFQTTAADDGSYTIRDVPVGQATVAWTATTTGGSGAAGTSLGDARRDGQLEVGLTAGANRVDIQL
jgi:hypothetical protein